VRQCPLTESAGCRLDRVAAVRNVRAPGLPILCNCNILRSYVRNACSAGFKGNLQDGAYVTPLPHCIFVTSWAGTPRASSSPRSTLISLISSKKRSAIASGSWASAPGG
jgi:hypothetical protein